MEKDELRWLRNSHLLLLSRSRAEKMRPSLRCQLVMGMNFFLLYNRVYGLGCNVVGAFNKRAVLVIYSVKMYF